MSIIIQITAPIASNRKAYANNYGESYSYISPITVYGFLLSLVGEHNIKAHENVQLAFAYKNKPEKSRLIKKQTKIKLGILGKAFSKKDSRDVEGLTPDYIEKLSDVNMICSIDSSREIGTKKLEERVVEAIKHPENIFRSVGVLSLGTSDDLIDDLYLLDSILGEKLLKLVPNKRGKFEMPIWLNHLYGIGNKFQRYLVKETTEGFLENDYVAICS